MKLLLTGATGFVGAELSRVFAGAGHEVYAIVREAKRAPSSHVTPVEWDLRRPLDARALPARVDAIVHLAQANVAFPEGAGELYRVNTASTQELLDYARGAGATRFLLASSGAVYGLGTRPFRETDALPARDFYAVTKLGSEQLVAAYAPFFPGVVLRFFFPYGPGQTGRLVPRLIGSVRSGEPVVLKDGGRPRINPIFIEDAVRAIVHALGLEEPQVLNVAGDEVVGIRELAELIGSVVGREPVFDSDSSGSASDLVADTTRLQGLFPLRPLVPLEEGLRRTVGAG